MNEDTEFEELGTRIWTDSEQLTEEDLEQYLALYQQKEQEIINAYYDTTLRYTAAA